MCLSTIIQSIINFIITSTKCALYFFIRLHFLLLIWLNTCMISIMYTPWIFYTLLYSILFYSALLYSTLLCSALLYSTLLYSTLLCSALLYSALLCFHTCSSLVPFSSLSCSPLSFSLVLCYLPFLLPFFLLEKTILSSYTSYFNNLSFHSSGCTESFEQRCRTSHHARQQAVTHCQRVFKSV